MNLDYKLIGARLAKVRKNANLTQDAAAKLVGVTKGYISNIEKGKKPSLEYLAAISHATNTSLDSILFGIQNDVVNISAKEIMELFLLVPESIRPFVFGIIKTIIETGLKHTESSDIKNLLSTSMSGTESGKTKNTDIA